MHRSRSQALLYTHMGTAILGLTVLAAPVGLRLPGALLVLALAAAVALGQMRRTRRATEHAVASLQELAHTPVADAVWQRRPAEAPGDPLASALDQVRQHVCQEMAAVVQERAQLASILASITEGILVIGGDGRVIMANQAAARLLAVRGELVGRTPVEVVRNNAVEQAIGACLDAERKAALEVTVRRNGECQLDVHIAPLSLDGRRAGAVVVLYDTTRLHQLERVRKDFVANVSHELRTPLTAIKGYAETLAEGALDDRKAALRFIQVISTHADRLNRLLDDILDLSKLESEHQAPELATCGLRALAETCLSAVVQAATRKRLQVALEIDPALRVTCDAKMIEQALLNLLDNAVKYTAEGGRISVTAAPMPPALEPDGRQRLAVAVRDTGIGIPSRDLERVFERFYRVDKGRSRALGGTGLGLAIVRHIMAVHGERVWVESELGNGSTFSFSLPQA